MISITTLQKYFSDNKVFITAHASEKCRMRGIKTKDIRAAIMGGEVIEQYPNDFPFASCLVFGYDEHQKPVHVVMSDEGSSSRVITAYIPSLDKWENDLKTRKVQI